MRFSATFSDKVQQGFHLVEGEYQEIQPNQQGWLWSQQLQLFLGINQNQLRFFTDEGELVPRSQLDYRSRN